MTDLGLRGVNAAIPLPMNADQSADFESFKSLCEWLNTQNVDAVTVNADTAEGAHLTMPERVKMIEIAKETLSADTAVVSGIMGTSTAAAVETATTLKAAGADALLVFSIPGFSGKPLPDAMVTTYYRRLREVGLPLIAFSLTPDLGGAILSQSAVTEMANDDVIVAIKDASFDPLAFLDTRQALWNADREVVLLSGCDNFIYESFVMGRPRLLARLRLDRRAPDPQGLRARQGWRHRNRRAAQPREDAAPRGGHVRQAAAQLARTHQGRAQGTRHHRHGDRPRTAASDPRRGPRRHDRGHPERRDPLTP